MLMNSIFPFQGLYDKFLDPQRWAMRLGRLPFRLGLWSLGPGTYLAYQPARYFDYFNRHMERTERDVFKSVDKFVRGNPANYAGDMPRYFFFNLVIDQIIKEKLPGDIAEIGVYKGNTASLLADAARCSKKTAYLFDTYDGFPQSDIQGIDSGQEIRFQDTSLPAVKALVGEQNTKFIQGFFPETTAQIPGDLSFCLVHIDCDLYAPIRAGLDYFYSRLVPGGFLIVHDYSSLEWAGAEKAVDEFFADRPEKVIPIPDAWGTAVIRKA
jgi:hypothetical protein